LRRVIRSTQSVLAQVIALDPARQRPLNHTRGFPNHQAMARPSFFQSPLLVQLQTQIEAQIKDQLGLLAACG
jgi:hypothetical protein